MTLYARAQATVAGLMAKYGQRGALRRTTVAGGGPADKAGGTATPVDHDCNFAVFPVTQADIDGTTIKHGDFRVILDVSELTITPKTTDQIVAWQGVLSIIDAGQFAPAGTVTQHTVFARL